MEDDFDFDDIDFDDLGGDLDLEGAAGDEVQVESKSDDGGIELDSLDFDEDTEDLSGGDSDLDIGDLDADGGLDDSDVSDPIDLDGLDGGMEDASEEPEEEIDVPFDEVSMEEDDDDALEDSGSAEVEEALPEEDSAVEDTEFELDALDEVEEALPEETPAEDLAEEEGPDIQLDVAGSADELNEDLNIATELVEEASAASDDFDDEMDLFGGSDEPEMSDEMLLVESDEDDFQDSGELSMDFGEESSADVAPDVPVSDALFADAPVEMGSLSGQQGSSAPPLGQDVLLNMEHQISVEVGRACLTGSEITQLTYGSIIELNKSIGDTIDVVFSGNTIAYGEVVSINDEQLGIRITGIVED